MYNRNRRQILEMDQSYPIPKILIGGTADFNTFLTK